MNNGLKKRIKMVQLFLETQKKTEGRDEIKIITDTEATEIYSRVMESESEKLYIKKGLEFLCIDEIESEKELSAVYDGYSKGAIELFIESEIKNYKQVGFV